MKKKIIIEELNNRKKILEEKGYKVLYIGLYGSQNYNLDDKDSDIDVKAIVKDDKNIIDINIECNNGNITIKDLKTFYNSIKDGSFSYVESIQTEYWIGDKKIKELFGKIKPNLKTMLKAMYEKRMALTYEYPSKHKEFEKWGFDPKQYHHIIRLKDLIENNLKTNSNKSYIKYHGLKRKKLINIKRNKYNYSKEKVVENSDSILLDIKEKLKNYEYKETIIEEINKHI